jgi:hypothetical protein
MNYYQCLAIGINRYHFCPPLINADADAQALYQFFCQEAGILAENLLLLTDTSPHVQGHSTYPNQDNLFYWLESKHKKSHNPVSAPLWLFFRGYGFTYQGEDYLLPIDGNPQDLPKTGISVRSLLAYIREQTLQPILLILDLTPVVVGTPVGQQTVNLGKQMGIGVILYPRRADENNADIFSTALLEALSYYRYQLTLTQLSQYLCDRLSDLNDQQGQPLPTPVIISPNLSFSSQFLLPSPQIPVKVAQTAPSSAYISQESVATITLPKVIPLARENPLPSLILSEQKIETKETETPVSVIEPLPDLLPEIPTPITGENNSQPPISPLIFGIDKIKDVKWFWLGGISGLLLAFLIVQLVRLNLFPPSPVANVPESSPSNSPESSPLPAERKLLAQARRYLKDNQASGFSRAIKQAEKISPQSPFYQEAQVAIKRWSEMIWDIAQGRANQGNFHDAIAAASLVPKTQTQLYSLSQETIKKWKIAAKQQQINLALIDGAKALIKPNQASSYNRSITILNQIPPAQPGYEQAKSLINQWSRQIYLIANSRAAQGKFNSAIETLQLVPPDTLSYSDAQKAISKWQKHSIFKQSDQ